MGCCRSTPRVSYPSGGRQSPPTPTIRRKYIVRYKKDGEMVTREYEGGRSEEVKAERLASLNRGTCQKIMIKEDTK